MSLINKAMAMAPRGLAGYAGAAGIGAVAGGTASWMTGGSFVQGAVFGAGAGAGMRGARLGMGMNRKAVQSGITQVMGHFGMDAASQYTKSVTRLAATGTSRQGRMAMFAGGAMLAGGVFGGRRNMSRGFNQNRGNRIGR